MQGRGFGKTTGILIHEWSLLLRHRELREHELVTRLPYPWKVLCKRRASRKDQLCERQQNLTAEMRSCIQRR